MVCYGSTQRVEPVLPLSDWTEDRDRHTITADSNALDQKALDQIRGGESCASHHQIHALHFKILAIRSSPGWERNSDVRHLDPKTVQHMVQDRFAHLCVCVCVREREREGEGQKRIRVQSKNIQVGYKIRFCQRRIKFLYLHPRQRKCVLQPVFSILLRVGVQHDIVHLIKRKRGVMMLNLFVYHALQRKNSSYMRILAVPLGCKNWLQIHNTIPHSVHKVGMLPWEKYLKIAAHTSFVHSFFLESNFMGSATYIMFPVSVFTHVCAKKFPCMHETK